MRRRRVEHFQSASRLQPLGQPSHPWLRSSALTRPPPRPDAQVLKTPALQAKAALLKKRARNICSEIDEKW